MRLREPRNFFPYVLGSVWLVPRPRHACEALGDAWAQPGNLVCNGPFVLVEQTPDSVVLEANPHWSGPRGNVREIRVTYGGTSDELLARMISTTFPSATSSRFFSARTSGSGLTTLESPAWTTTT